ncbi:hypothetical protein [Microbulbifer halophilus]|uniref:hypothetical protein n=1 Tax=Microbulbifer halophilus TaxID=453963 RepID=UPI00360640DA
MENLWNNDNNWDEDMDPKKLEMRKSSDNRLRDIKLLEKYYDIHGEGVSALRLDKAFNSPRFKIAVRKLFDADLTEKQSHSRHTR